MTRHTVSYRLNNEFVGDVVGTNHTPVIPRIGEEVRLSGMNFKVIRVILIPESHISEVHLSR